MSGIRAKESVTNDVYVNVNDLLIELHLELGKALNESERTGIKKMIARLTTIRDKSRGSNPSI